MSNANLVRAYSRESLEFFLQRLQKGLFVPFTALEIEAELKRRADLAEKALDTVKYPELQPTFH